MEQQLEQTEKPKILLVDDEDLLLVVTSRMLSRGGYEVHTALSAELALKKLETEHVDMLITDINMPKVTGLELLEEVKSRYPELACMIMTGHGDLEYAIKAMELGAFNFVTKPVDNKLILKVLEREMIQVNLRKEIEYSRKTRDLMLKQQQFTFDLITSSVHSIKNYIGGTLLFIENLEDSVDDYEMLQDLLNEEILGAVKGNLGDVSGLVQTALKGATCNVTDEYQVFDPAEIVVRNLLVLEQQLKKSDISIESNNIEAGLFKVQGIPFVLQIAVNNIVQNGKEEMEAILGNTEGSVYMQVSMDQQDGELLLRVSNIGRAIDDEYKEKIFLRGESAKSEIIDSSKGNSTISGFGIGLYDTRNSVEELGGSVWVEDFCPQDENGVPGEVKGASFVIKLPLLQE